MVVESINFTTPACDNSQDRITTPVAKSSAGSHLELARSNTERRAALLPVAPNELPSLANPALPSQGLAPLFAALISLALTVTNLTLAWVSANRNN